MKTLHTINKAGQPTNLCLRAAARGDTVLLIEDGVYELMSATERLTSLAENCSVVVMGSDARARGIAVPGSFGVIDYEQFVALSVEHDKVLSWF